MTSTLTPSGAPTARLLLPATASEAEWHAARAGGIGGSDVAAILGLDPYRGPLHVYEAKHGRDLFKGNEYTEVGTDIEDFIAGQFAKRSGMDVTMPPGTLVHVDHPWARVNVDRYVLWSSESDVVAGPLECKNRSEFQAADWEDGQVPDAPALQCHWGMAVGGWDVGWVCALVGGNKVRWARLERDEEMVDYLLDFCGTWYQRHVLEGRPPEPGGLETTTELLSKLWSVKPEAVGTVDAAEAKALRAQYLDLKAQAKALEAQITSVGNRMRQLSGANEVIKADGKPAWTWKQNGSFASSRFAAEHPEVAAEFTTTVEALDVTRLKEERPDLYRQFRSRQLLVPAKGI